MTISFWSLTGHNRSFWTGFCSFPILETERPWLTVWFFLVWSGLVLVMNQSHVTRPLSTKDDEKWLKQTFLSYASDILQDPCMWPIMCSKPWPEPRAWAGLGFLGPQAQAWNFWGLLQALVSQAEPAHPGRHVTVYHMIWATERSHCVTWYGFSKFIEPVNNIGYTMVPVIICPSLPVIIGPLLPRIICWWLLVHWCWWLLVNRYRWLSGHCCQWLFADDYWYIGANDYWSIGTDDYWSIAANDYLPMIIGQSVPIIIWPLLPMIWVNILVKTRPKTCFFLKHSCSHVIVIY